MNSTVDRSVEKYLKRLDAELADLPRGRRREIVEEIGEHIAEAQAERPVETEADIRTLLERLGDPADIAAEARQRFGVPVARPGWMETAALVFLLVGGFVFFFGWFIGLVLLWSSAVWTPWEKLLGTLVIPGGLALPFFLVIIGSWGATDESCSGEIDPNTGQTIGETCTSGVNVLLFIGIACLFAAPLITTAYLAKRMRRQRELATA
jgi:hypothetical protein